jgi:predicted metal-dependent hydrolase
MDSAKEKIVCNSQAEQLDLIRRWCDALEGSKKEVAFDLMNQVMDEKITNERAFALLDT